MQTMKKTLADGRRVLALVVVIASSGCGPPGPQSLLDGERLVRAGKYEEAIEKLKTAARLLPRNAQAWNHLGLAYHGAGQADNARKAYQEALKLDRDLAAARFNLGSLYLEQNRPAEAVAEFTTFTIQSPSSTNGLIKLGYAQIAARQWAAAENTLARVRKVAPSNPEVLNGLGLLQLQKKNTRDALGYFNAALQSRPVYPPALLNLAILTHQSLSNRPLALRMYRDYATLQPRPANWMAVEEVARRLDLELNPPPTPAPTNQLAQTSAPTNGQKAPTNQLAVATPRAQSAIAETRPSRPPSSSSPDVTNAPKPGLAKTMPKPEPAPKAEMLPAVTKAVPQPEPVMTPTPPPSPVKPAPAPLPAIKPQPVPEPAKVATATAPVVTPASPSRAMEPTPQPLPTVKPQPAPRRAKVAPALVPAVKPAPPPLPMEPPLVVVKVPPPPVTAPSAPLATVESKVTPSVPQSAAVPEPAMRPDSQTDAKPEKPGFFQRLNPMKLFRSKALPPTPLPPSKKLARANPPPASPIPATPRTPAAPVTPSVEAVQPAVSPPPPPPKPAPRRHRYLMPAPPAAGNRAEAQPFFEEGMAAQQKRKLTEAIAAYRSAIRHDPAFFESYYNLGLAAMETGDLAQSLVAYEYALTVEPDSADARFNFALALQRAGFPRDAADELERLLAGHPDEVRAHLTLANVCARELAEPQRAREHYLRVLQLNPKHSQAAAIGYWLMGNP